MKSTYLLVNICSAIVPLLFSFYPAIRFDKHFRAFVVSNSLVLLLFVTWDIVFTARGIWGFSNRYTYGLMLVNLPLEEILFFICIPFACVFTYHCLNKFFSITWKPGVEKWVVTGIALFLLATGIVFISLAYTSVTFISTALLLLFLQFIIRAKWLPKFLSVYPVLLIPFFIVNGLLTGTGLSEPVVWYNNHENLGVRLITIPVEDVVYGMELLLCNVFLYEQFKTSTAGKILSLQRN
jgi:lycopene cyclase domain-containing protein